MLKGTKLITACSSAKTDFKNSLFFSHIKKSSLKKGPHHIRFTIACTRTQTEGKSIKQDDSLPAQSCHTVDSNARSWLLFKLLFYQLEPAFNYFFWWCCTIIKGPVLTKRISQYINLSRKNNIRKTDSSYSDSRSVGNSVLRLLLPAPSCSPMGL